MYTFCPAARQTPNKAAIALAGLIVVGGAGAMGSYPLIAAHQVESALTGFEGGQFGGVVYAHSIDEYESGYARSRASGRMTLIIEGERIELLVDHDLKHGFGAPIVKSSYRVAPGANEAQQALAKVTGDNPFLFSTVTVQSGGSRIALDMPAFRSSPPDFKAVYLDFGGLTGSIDFDGPGARGWFSMGASEANDDQRLVKIGPQRLEFDRADLSDQLSPATMIYSLDRLESFSHGRSLQKQGEAHDLRLSLSQEMNGELIRVDGQLSIGRGAAQAGSLENLSLTLKGERLHRGVFDALIEQTQAAFEGRRASYVASEALARTFLVASPKLELTVGMGRSGADGSVTLSVGYRHREGVRIDLDDEAALMTAIEANLAADFTRQFVVDLVVLSGDYIPAHEIADELKGAVCEGFLVQTDRGYRASAGFERGSLRVNDRARPDLLMGLMMGLAGLGLF